MRAAGALRVTPANDAAFGVNEQATHPWVGVGQLQSQAGLLARLLERRIGHLPGSMGVVFAAKIALMLIVGVVRIL
jgi:hypothetical protein